MPEAKTFALVSMNENRQLVKLYQLEARDRQRQDTNSQNIIIDDTKNLPVKIV